ncbi:hypothetical protein EW145_g3240 [Phellinidium pouzarii]|uniref:GH18 domain-containing protein n=1 Tax=Phellinidium pouzarii TaxID=167371 RepID=A0A4S4LD58_9AGAM|nr:hypothetical protein EW145_g3240 [Phellinidium pouzarii]
MSRNTGFDKRAPAKVQAAYFTNWGIYGANFQPADINPTPLSHILYAFADIQSDGTIVLTDSNIKVLLSIGGWTYSQDSHFAFVSNSTSRRTFVNAAVQLIKDYGFDGIDIDFEYPSNSAQGQGFADLLTSLRTAFNQLAAQKGDTVPYQLTAAVPAGFVNYANLNVPQMDAALSYWNLMAYDYAGSWLNFTDNQANVYDGVRTNVSTDKAVTWYIKNGATAGKINMGIPLYGRAFENTTGIGQPYNGIGPGTIQAGIYSYSDLPLAGASVFENVTDVSSYSYDASKMELVSYDTPHIATIKAQYVINKGMAGQMFWDLSTDKTNSSDSLVTTTANVFGALDKTKNHINYPDSKWDNIRNNMRTSTGTSTVADTSTVTGTKKSTGSSPPSTPTSGACGGVTAWSSSTVYVAGNKVSYNGHLWTAKWWTEGDTPNDSGKLYQLELGQTMAHAPRLDVPLALLFIFFNQSPPSSPSLPYFAFPWASLSFASRHFVFVSIFHSFPEQ